MWPYFLTRFGLVQAGTIEERPGIPATPGHITKLVASMKEDKIRLILTVPWGDRRLAESVAHQTGAKAVVVASSVGAVKGTDTYLDTIDYNIRTVVQALK
jgi:zinc/manganese transport system substrate-binding protein